MVGGRGRGIRSKCAINAFPLPKDAPGPAYKAPGFAISPGSEGQGQGEQQHGEREAKESKAENDASTDGRKHRQ